MSHPRFQMRSSESYFCRVGAHNQCRIVRLEGGPCRCLCHSPVVSALRISGVVAAACLLAAILVVLVYLFLGPHA